MFKLLLLEIYANCLFKIMIKNDFTLETQKTSHIIK